MISFHGMKLRPSATAEAFVATDWAATDLGAPDGWPASLKTSVQLCLNSIFPMTLTWGPSYVTIYNDGYLPIMQDKHPSGLGRPVVEVYPELVDLLFPALQAVRERGETVFAQNRKLPLDRGGMLEEVYFTFSFSPINDALGETQGALAVATDTTEQVLQQRRSIMVASLADDLSKLNSLDPVVPVVRQAIAGNPDDFAGAALLAVAGDGSATVRWREAAGAEGELLSSPAVTGHLERLREAGKHSRLYRLQERLFALTLVDDEALNGRAFVLLVAPGDLVKIDGRYQKLLRVVLETLIGAAYRILAERRALRELTRQRDERERLYGLLFRHSHDGIFLCSPNGSVTAANPAACALLGYSEVEIQDLGRMGFLAEDDRSRDAVAERERKGTFVGELRFRRKDGSELTADVSSTVFRDEVGGEERTITIFRDAAPRLITQERIASTARLEAVGALTGGIAHDFNNLLNVIINGAEDLVDRLPEEDSAREAADMVLTASVRAADLTRQLLAFSRQQPMQARPLDVGGILSELDQILDRAMGGGIDVRVDLQSGLIAMADHSLLQSAILNLCINARDAMAAGGTLTIATGSVAGQGALAEQARLSAGDYVRISVSDTGVGISRENLDRVLEPFFTTKPVGHGTGLGLSMVYGFVRQSGGGMRMLSEPGRGTRVELFLPAAADGALVERDGPANPAGPVTRSGSGRRLLVVEDEDLLGAMLARILEEGGYRVKVCRTAESALAVLEADGDYDLVITDILLGSGMDGWTLLQRIETTWPSLPVVTMSGFIPQEGAEVRRVPSLHKPFRPHEVLALIGARLHGAGGAAPAREAGGG